MATADWYPSDFVRPEYKPTAKYQGPFALQLIMAAAPTPTVFGWAVKMADDKCRSLYRTVVGNWNELACNAGLFPPGAAADRKWTDPKKFIVDGSRMFKAGLFRNRTLNF